MDTTDVDLLMITQNSEHKSKELESFSVCTG